MKIAPHILTVLQSATFNEPSTVILNGELDRKTYTDTNKLLESIGLKWNRKLKAHVSSEDVSEKWYNMIDTGEWVDIQKEYQYFPTPKEIVQQMIDMIDWGGRPYALEPSFGSGNILFEIPHEKCAKVYGCELNTDMFKETKSKSIGIENMELSNIDFLEVDGVFNIILANPPFTKLQSIKHFNHMVELLNQNGQLVCILPSGDYDKGSSIKLRQEFTKFVDDNCEVIHLDSGDFKESGTMVKTIIVKYVKK